MAEFISSNEKTVDIGDPVFFENKTDSNYEVSAGIIFKKSGVYEVSIVGNKTCVTKVGERKTGRWVDGCCSACGISKYNFITICHGDEEPRGTWTYCPSCGSYNGGEQK